MWCRVRCGCGAGAVQMRWRRGSGGGARVPPHVEEDDVVGTCDVKADATCADGHEQHQLARVGLEVLESL